ncbi:hypothetical protein QOK74_08230 [Staphylococcus saprophyticus]|uniref:hypothetical protein n=1 Tax=Staphylococcus saprophyticus TaxID=29385 RepID=UPI0024C39E47|nr:hypothetical protein [Staphylococcus saprophyticus]MDK1672858.1 hypothetical protein [Staphylococcus saprophyticus]
MVKVSKLFNKDIYESINIKFFNPNEFYKVVRKGNKIVWDAKQISHIFDLHHRHKIPIVYIAYKFDIHHETIRAVFKKYKKPIYNFTTYERKYKFNERYFQQIDNPDKAYWLGFIYADGCVLDKQKALKLCLSSVDCIHLDFFRKDIESNHGFEFTPPRIKNGYSSHAQATLKIYSDVLADDLINLGCVPRKTKVLKFPNNDIVPQEFILDFIRGYTDGDGSLNYSSVINKNGSTYRKYCIEWGGTQSMLEGILKIMKLHVTTKAQVRPTNIDGFYKLKLSGNKNFKIITDILYNTEQRKMLRKSLIKHDFEEYIELRSINKERIK